MHAKSKPRGDFLAFFQHLRENYLARAQSVLVGLLMSSHSHATPPEAPIIYQLKTDSLIIEIEVDSSRLREEFGPRFDETAFVRSVRSNGVELIGPWGLTDEFGLLGDGVLGYEQAAMHDPFIKIGVGKLIKNTAGNYAFDHRYPVRTEFPVNVSFSDNTLTVSQTSTLVNGFQYDYAKTYILSPDGELSIQYRMKNIGKVSWTFEHYNHHWFRASSYPIDGHYRVLTSFNLPVTESTFIQHTQSLEVPKRLESGEAAYYVTPLKDPSPNLNQFTIQLKRQDFVHYEGSASPERFALYADAAGFCPEIFSKHSLAPTEELRWSSNYRFVAPQ